MKTIKKSIFNKKILNYFIMSVLILNLTSCWYGSDDADPIVIGQNIYKGILIDLEGNPIGNKTILLRSRIFDQHIAQVNTNEDGTFEVQGDIYDIGISVALKDDENKFLTQYTFDWTEYPINEIIEFPPLISAPTSVVDIDVINNTGLDYSVDYQYTIGICRKFFEDNIEIDTLCYEDFITTLNFDSDNEKSFGIGAVNGTTITVTVSNTTDSVTETFLVQGTSQEETITFE
jgi:hypothetical protein